MHQRFFDAQIGVFQFHIFADQADVKHGLLLADVIREVAPAGQSFLRIACDRQVQFV